MRHHHTIYYVGGPMDANKVTRYGNHPLTDTELVLERLAHGSGHVDAAGISFVKAKEVAYRITRSAVEGVFIAYPLEDLRA